MKGVILVVNVNKLKGKIVEKGMTIESVAKAIGIDTSTFYRKLQTSGEKFTIKEADDITTFLGLEAAEATSIFFSQLVA